MMNGTYKLKNTQVKCECGKIVTKRQLTRHKKTKIHNELLNGKQ